MKAKSVFSSDILLMIAGELEKIGIDDVTHVITRLVFTHLSG